MPAPHKRPPPRLFVILRGVALFLLCGFSSIPVGWSQNRDVSLRVEIAGRPLVPGKRDSLGGVVVWLSAVDKSALPQHPTPSQNYKLVQKDKQFTPHLLVVPTGSEVDFPNQDPFFHNVFSLFNGKRFDLGLYESHAHRKVKFDREGVSYIFCNIHPEMAAVVVSLSTPHYAVSTPVGAVVIHDVAPGNYRLNVWAENVAPSSLEALSRTVAIGPLNQQLGALRLQRTEATTAHHKNKFGEDYPPDPAAPY